MEADGVDIASGDWGLAKTGVATKAPQGAGRLISRDVKKAVLFRFPTMYGYESWVLHKAEQLGFLFVKSGPFVRSSFQADDVLNKFTFIRQ